MLWEAGCSVTIQIRYCPDPADWTLACHKASESVKALGASAPALSDTFLKFCTVVETLNVQSLQEGVKLNLTFNNAPYNASMHKAVQAVQSVLHGGCGSRVFETSMTRLEMKFGRELLSNAYSKLHRLVVLARKGAKPERPTHAVAAWLVDMLYVALSSNLLSVIKSTEAALDRD